MHLHHRVGQILRALRPAFNYEPTYVWFVLLMWGVLISNQPPAITSYLNALGLPERFYPQALHWFYSQAWSAHRLCQMWAQWLVRHPMVHRLHGQLVYVGDGIKVAKEGHQMPGVKRLHQESSNVSKREWIRGHYFGALHLLLTTGSALVATPIAVELHDGLKLSNSDKSTLVDKMAAQCITFMEPGSYAILDAYFAAANLIKTFRADGLHLISRVRITTVGKAPFCVMPGKHGPGRPRKWGNDIKIRELFAHLDEFTSVTVCIYGKSLTVRCLRLELHWDSPEHRVQFVLSVLPCGKQIILVSTDLTLSATEVIEAYGWRFKIEVCFRSLVHLLGGFCYRFWLRSMEQAPHWPEDMVLEQYPQEFQQQVARKVEAFERFVNLNAIALGILQVLSLEMPDWVWQGFPGWFRTLPKHGYPTEQIVRITLQHQTQDILSQSRPGLLFIKFLRDKLLLSHNPDPQELAS